MTQDPPVEYKASEIRDRLANERTLLSWIRTALAIIALGLAVAKLALFLEAFNDSAAQLKHMPDPRVSFAVGAILVGFGGVLSLVGAWRSYKWNLAIDPQGKPPENITLGLVALSTSTISFALLIYLLV
jgi:putative membrane protein